MKPNFARMSKEKLRRISLKGAKALHKKNLAHKLPKGATEIFSRGGKKTAARGKAHMAAIGRKGGRIAGMHRREAREAREENKP